MQGTLENKPDRASEGKSESPRLETILDASRPAETGPRTEPAITLDMLRRKLDAAILDEAWDAVKVINERMHSLELELAGNVITIDRGRRR